MFRIHCEVYGGVTGHRQGMMKDGEGRVREFETREEAEKALPESKTTERGVTFSYFIIEAR